MEQEEVNCSACYAAVGEVEDGAEEGAGIIHPRKLVVEQREIEHIHYHSEHKGKGGTWSYRLRPYIAIEETVHDVSQSSGCDQSQTYKHS